jgi:hypothetical protein
VNIWTKILVFLLAAILSAGLVQLIWAASLSDIARMQLLFTVLIWFMVLNKKAVMKTHLLFDNISEVKIQKHVTEKDKH